MGLFFRRSTKLGPFRLNFSKSGIGVSAGIKGARVSMGPKGTYVNLGRHGLYYKQKVGEGYAHTSSRREQPTDNPVRQVMQSLPSNLNYPVFPKHGLPRIVTTLGLLCIPIIIILWLVLVIAIGVSFTDSNSKASNANLRAAVEDKREPTASSRSRGYQVGVNYALSSRNSLRSNRLDQSSVKKLAARMAKKANEDEEWQLGWIEGYNKAYDSSEPAGTNDKTMMTAQPTRLNPPTTSAPQLGSSRNGYIRGPRGGCYYLSGSGRKIYVDRTLCN